MSNKRAMWWLGQLIAIMIGFGIGGQTSFWLGYAAYYATAVLVDIRLEVSKE